MNEFWLNSAQSLEAQNLQVCCKSKFHNPFCYYFGQLFISTACSLFSV